MKRPSLGGLTAMGVLVLAIGGGAVGGALAAGGQPAPAAPVQQVQSVADEATVAPPPAVTSSATPEAASEPVREPVSDPTPTIEDVPKAETAQQAADRARAEADRAQQQADRAAEVAARATVAPAPAPPAPEPAAEVAPKPIMSEEEAAAKAEQVKKHHDVMGEQLPGVNGYVPPAAPTPGS